MAGRENCQRCKEAALVRELNPKMASTVFTVTFNDTERYFDVDHALALLGNLNALPPGAYFDADVDDLWDKQVRDGHHDVGHLDCVDMSAPLLFATFLTSDPNSLAQVMIDGSHRTARAKRDGIKTLRAVRLTPEMSAAVEISAEDWALSQILTEIVANGGDVRVHDGAIVVVGDIPKERLGDSPARRGILASLKANGMGVFALQ